MTNHHKHLDGSNVLFFAAKAIRASAIHVYVRQAAYQGVVCFSCGNASAALKATGLDVLEIGPKGPVQANSWWSPADIHRIFPTRFDATSGHLPMHLMHTIGGYFRAYLGDLPDDRPIIVPTGSGETLCCLAMAYPEVRFIARYDQSSTATSRHPKAPLNDLVYCLACEVVY
jgi:hypothetical protein